MGTSWPLFLGLTCGLAAFVAALAGHAMANAWRPLRSLVFQVLLIGAFDRFLAFALFSGDLLSPAGYTLDTAVVLAAAVVSYRRTRAARMVSQYPWLYERAGPFGWREKG